MEWVASFKTRLVKMINNRTSSTKMHKFYPTNYREGDMKIRSINDQAHEPLINT